MSKVPLCKYPIQVNWISALQLTQRARSLSFSLSFAMLVSLFYRLSLSQLSLSCGKHRLLFRGWFVAEITNYPCTASHRPDWVIWNSDQIGELPICWPLARPAYSIFRDATVACQAQGSTVRGAWVSHWNSFAWLGSILCLSVSTLLIFI